MRPICEDRSVWGGAPVGCGACGGAYFERHPALPYVDDYWEGDEVNARVYTATEVRHAFIRKYERYLALLRSMNSGYMRLLEVGCGSGIFLETALAHGCTAYGVDISQQAVDLARQNCPRAQVICSALEDAGLPESSFDCVAMWDVIEHAKDPEALLSQACRLLRPGGVLLLETPDEGCPARGLVRVLHRATKGRLSFLGALYYPTHRWYFTRYALRLILERNGFARSSFYREQTVGALRRLKTTFYGSRRTMRQRLIGTLTETMGVVPWLRNKMVVISVSSRSPLAAG